MKIIPCTKCGTNPILSQHGEGIFLSWMFKCEICGDKQTWIITGCSKEEAISKYNDIRMSEPVEVREIINPILELDVL